MASQPRPVRHFIEYAAYRLTRWKWSLLPETWAARVGAMTGWIAGTVVRIRRREAEENVARAFPQKPSSWHRQVALASYVHLGREAALLLRMDRWSSAEVRSRVRFEELEEVERAVEAGSGVVVLTAHLGNWEIAGAGLAARGLPLDVVGKGMANLRFQEDLFATRERLGMRVIEIRDAPRGVLRALGRGRVAALLWDQNAHRNGIFVPFFGTPAATPRGPALFALRTGAPVFVGFAIREAGWRAEYVLRAERLEIERSGDLEVDVAQLASAYHAVLERAIRAHPEQYFWQHRRWKTRPPEEEARNRR